MRLTRPKSPVAQAVVPVVVGLAFIALLGLAVWGVAAWASHSAGQGSKVQVNLGEDTFNMGPAKQRSEEVAARGPLLFPGLVSPDKGYIVVNHAGTDELAGWVAFAAVPPGSQIACAVQWQAGPQEFKDPCTGTAYPADGTGLQQYRVAITPDRELEIDLGRGSTTTAATG
jgi:hypothetical protein